ncbi:NmrA family transcriptional regulator [Arthrobacter caoxuetaonis]|uniref:NmrA family transcriptional regulator n=1 Tax=Arthrobacter caoxuetaonis TaxID=2886935 RepID=UPI001D15D188|nr:NmrA family transcriptional regulator [Arthrobacter caoxuetaonis]MCC3282083.1 NmrA family transcriptional regulator [Arthrobacter caoxuetaonis]
MDTKTSILITGATGRTGRRLVSALSGVDGLSVRAASRQGGPPFAWEAPDTWPAQLSGADAAFICYAPDVADPGAPEILSEFAAAARHHGLSRLILLSGRGGTAAHPSEEAVLRNFPAAVVVRSAWFQQDFSEHFLHPQVLEGQLRVPVNGVSEPFVDLEDSAEALAHLLTEADAYREVASGILEFTGPDSVTFDDVAAALSAALGRTVEHAPTTPEDFIAGAADAGMSREEAEGIVWLFAEAMDGSASHSTGDLERLLGRPPQPIQEYIARTAAQGVWDEKLLPAAQPQPQGESAAGVS